MGWVCEHCGRMMRLRAVAIYPPATTKMLSGLRVNLLGLGFTGPLGYFCWGFVPIHMSRLFEVSGIVKWH